MLLVEHSYKQRVHIDIEGIVQGVGFRPFVYKLASTLKLHGYVRNNSKGVVIEVQGKQEVLKDFVKQLTISYPPLSRIDTLEKKEISLQEEKGFEILFSTATQATAMLPPDIALCDACAQEFDDKSNRRYQYPFMNCTDCGPRFSIIKALPYDRKNSSMEPFLMCQECQLEYENPNNRRYHAQPISCYKCGPQLYFESFQTSNNEGKLSAMEATCKAIESGEIVAIKGIGGFHLVCDASNDESVKKLRKRKNRERKPFAVMFTDLKSIEDVAILTDEEKELLQSAQKPIVLVKKRENNLLSKVVAPNIDIIGVFLGYTPLHKILLEKLSVPLVATSANISDAPIMTSEMQIGEHLSHVADAMLFYDREILNACDDSIVMVQGEERLLIRGARGYMPRSFPLKEQSKKKILALGANQKNSIALAFAKSVVISPHIGDLNSLDAVEYFKRMLGVFEALYDFVPDVIVCDKHPAYETRLWAKEYVQKHSNVQLLEVQHHYAHTMACMHEKNLHEEVLAFCFDGTGYGDDGTLWGGEVLLATPQTYQRIYHLQEFALLGGEKAIKEPSRVALSLLFATYTLDEIKSMKTQLVKSFSKQELQSFYTMYIKNINTPKSTSIGRLFDGVYALSNHLEKLDFEGESGMILEKEAQKSQTEQSYTFTFEGDSITFDGVVKGILQESKTEEIAEKFMNTVVEMIIRVAREYKNHPLVFSGGVFQNRVLLEKVIQACKKEKREYYIQNETPINDGGIAFGQLYYALNYKG